MKTSRDDPELIKDSLLLIQCLIYYSPRYETTSHVLWPLMQLTKHSDPKVISESLYTLFVFNERFRESRQLLVKSRVLKEILDIWVDNTGDELIFKPIFGLITGTIARLPEYKEVLLGDDIDVLDIIPVLLKSGHELNKIYGNSIVKYVAMKAICNKYAKTEKQIQILIDKKCVELIAESLQNEPNIKVKRSALNAMFVITFNASKDQLKPLANGMCRISWAINL